MRPVAVASHRMRHPPHGRHDAAHFIRTADRSVRRGEAGAKENRAVSIVRSVREERASRNRRPCAHALANRVRMQESTDPARMTGNQPDPPRTGRGEMACRRMPAGGENDARAATRRLTAIAACRPRRVAIDHFSTPFQSRCLFRQPDHTGAPTIRRRRSVLAGMRLLYRAPTPHPRGPGPGRDRQRSLPNRTDLASSTFARLLPQGPGQLRASPSGQGIGLAARQPERVPKAGSYETETWGARHAPGRVTAVPCGIRLNNEARHYYRRAAGRSPAVHPDSRRNFAGRPRRNVSCALHAVGGTRAAGWPCCAPTEVGRPLRSRRTGTGPVADPVRAPLSRPADVPRRRTACRRDRRCRRCGRDRSARARSSSGRVSRVKCRVRRQPC